MGIYSTAGDVANENIRYAQGSILVRDATHPGQVVWAAHSLDLSRNGVNGLHYLDTSYSERARRSGWAWRKLKGYSTYDRLGPRLISGRVIDSTHIGVTFQLEGFDTMAASPGMSGYTTGKTDQYGGGLIFGTSVSVPPGSTGWSTVTGGKFIPNGPCVPQTPTAPASGTIELQCPFAGPLTTGGVGTYYIAAAYGEEPFNPEKSSVVQQDMTKASMYVGKISGENDVAFRSSWDASGIGLNYITIH